MRAAAALLIALLLMFASCSTAKKATEKQEARQELTANVEKTTGSNETTAATFDQAILEQILQRINITYDFERWNYGASPDQTLADSLPASSQTAAPEKEAQGDKPPNVRPTSYTKGSVNINAEGSQNRATQTTAGAQVNKNDSTSTAADVEKKDDRKAEKKGEQTPKSYGGLLVLFLLSVVSALYFFGQHITKKQ